MKTFRFILPALVLAMLCSALLHSQSAPFPLRPGMAVVTCYAPDILTPPFANNFVLGVIDARNPPQNLVGVNWIPPMYHGPGDSWTADNLGEVFGIAIDTAGNIYATATTSYGMWSLNRFIFGPGGPGGVYKIDGKTGSVSTFAQLPNTGPALGNICYDPVHDQLYVTNFEDGKIYRLDRHGSVLEAFDPMKPDNGLSGFAPLGERSWGIGVFDGTVYYGVWADDPGGRNPVASENTVRAVDLNSSGAFVASSDREVLRVSPPRGSPYIWTSPVSSISFAPDGRLLLAERTMLLDDFPNAHAARVMQFSGTPGAWSSSRTYNVGYFDPGFPFTGQNSAGGTDYAYGTYDPATDCVDDEAAVLWATGDALRFPNHNPDGGPGYVYGMVRIPTSGNTPATVATTSYFVDFDGDTASTFTPKTLIGDVRIFRPIVDPRHDSVEICTSEGILLAAREGVAYRWDMIPGLSCYDCNAPIATPTATATYRVRVALNEGVYVTDTITVVVANGTNAIRSAAGPESASDTSLFVPLRFLDDPTSKRIERFTLDVRYDPAFIVLRNGALPALSSMNASALTDRWSVRPIGSGAGWFTAEFTAPPGEYLDAAGIFAKLYFTPLLSAYDLSYLSFTVAVEDRPCLVVSAGDSLYIPMCSRNMRQIISLSGKHGFHLKTRSPVRGTTDITFSLGLDGPAAVEILDVMGRPIAVVADGYFDAGEHRLLWDASARPPGLYLCRLRSGEWSETRMMVVAQ